MGCAHTYHDASSIRVGLIVAQVLPRVKVIERKRGEARPRPLLLPDVCHLLNGGKHFLHRRGLQLLECFRFDLADSLPCHRKTLSHLLQCAGLILTDTEPQPDDGLLTGRERAENAFKLVRHFSPVYMGIGWDGLQVREQFPEFCASITYWLLQGNRLLKG